jgi:hypothetical protein
MRQQLAAAIYCNNTQALHPGNNTKTDEGVK